MNMGKRKWAILLIIALVIGTGSYVFANPSLDSSKDTLNPNHSVNPESNQSTGSNANSNVGGVNNQNELNLEDLGNMDIPSEELQILEDIILNNNANGISDITNETIAGMGTTTENIVSSILGNSGIGSNVSGNSDNNPGYTPSGNSGSNGSTGGNNTGSGNTGSTGSNTNQGGNTGAGTDANSGNTGGNTSGENGNTGEGNNTGDLNQGETSPSFVFEENGSFSTNTIVINDPNYDHMVVYNLDIGYRKEVFKNEFSIPFENSKYIFIVFYKNSDTKNYTMYHIKPE